jgi:hypothetical protein
VIGALWVHGSLPPDYVDLMLMRDVFHCPPSVLAEQDTDAVLRVLACLEAEAYVREAEEKRRGNGSARV